MRSRGSSPGSIAALIAIGLAIALLVVGGLGAFGGSRTVVDDSGSAELPADGSGGPFVLSKRDAPPPFTLFGIEFGRHTYTAHIGVVLPEGCVPGADGRITPDGPCRGIAAWGEVTGDGRLPGGQDFVVIGVEIGEDCFGALAPGDPWPPPHAACEA